MWLQVVSILLSLGIILMSCELFTNGVEWLGKKLRVGDGVVGSIFSAVGTCLPETFIPVIAILFSPGSENSADISIGAIIGAPFMLGTLAFFITGLSVIIFRKSRKTGLNMNVNIHIISRDIIFFILMYALGMSAALIGSERAKPAIALILAVSYVFYIIATVKQDRVNGNKIETLYFKKYVGIKSNKIAILSQIFFSLGGILFGAHLFVQQIGEISRLMKISAFVLSLIIAPVATELPEKFNSILWIRRNKDTLALGNITGAMVFQSCLPVSFGILATSWKLDIHALLSGVLALSSAALTLLWIKAKKKLSPLPLATGGIFYALFILFLFQ